MKCKIIDFCKKDKSFRRKRIIEYIKDQRVDILVSYAFILLSSSTPFFSFTNGAIWVLLWYTLSILFSLYIFIVQSEYNDGLKRAIRFSKKHAGITLERKNKYSAEIGGWNFLAAQFIFASIIYVLFAIFALVYQLLYYTDYMNRYRDFCVGVLVDTYILFFFTVYHKIVLTDLKVISGWKNKVSCFLHIFGGTIKRNLIIHIFSQGIILYALNYYFSKEFSGLFDPISRRILGSIYILYMLIDVKALIKKIIIQDTKKV